jgi:uncharacterized protein (DUF2062 family)
MFPNMMEARKHSVELNGPKNEGFFRRQIARPIVELLRQGVTPEKMALSLALGVALGVFPVLGTTTALCALVAFIWRLNLPAIQIVNYFVYPLQIALLIPFFRAGEKLFGRPHLPLSVTQILAAVHAISVDDRLARGVGVVLDRPVVCGIGLCGSGSDAAAFSEKDINGKGDRLKSVPLTKNRLQDVEDFFVAFERRNQIRAGEFGAGPS